MKNALSYKGYIGTVEFDSDDKILFGKVLGINDLVSYEGASVADLETDFKAAINDYLQMCKNKGRTPEKMFSGKFNVRIPPELHAMATIKANSRGTSLNKFVSEAIEKAV
jgi:predicted HicB family RNase H-like nuclease